MERGGLWGGVSKCKGSEACLVDGKKDRRQLEQGEGLCPLGSGGNEVRKAGRDLLIALGTM